MAHGKHAVLPAGKWLAQHKNLRLSIVITILAALLPSAAILPVRAQTVQGPPPPGDQALDPKIVELSGTAGRIAKFVTATTLGNSVLYENGGRIGLGTQQPGSKLDIVSQNALRLTGFQPFLTFRDSNAGLARHVIQSVGGGLNLLTDSYLKGLDPSAFVRIDNAGRVGLGTANPLRALQFGPSIDAAFTIEASSGSPTAGFIRFGDHTGWRLHIGRQREFSGGPLNTGLTGRLVSILDDGTLNLNGFPLGATGTVPLCRTPFNSITPCSASAASRQYRTHAEPYRGGLDVIDRLQPIAFTRTDTGLPALGLAAEEVEAAEPLLAYRNENGEVEGVNYDLLSVLFVNAIKQQQEQLQQQKQLIDRLQSRLERLEGPSPQRLSAK